jgi:thiamine kinase-like enzyme
MTDPDLFIIPEIYDAFRTDAAFRGASRIGSGHINDTFRITTEDPRISYVLQRINANVFKDIPGLMENIGIVTRHIENKILSGEPQARSFSALHLIQTADRQLFHKSERHEFWRLYNFIDCTKSYDVVEDPEMANKGGKAFGLFQYLTSDIPTGSLKETIPGFHDIEKRLNTFHEVVLADPESRGKELLPEIRFVDKREEQMLTLQTLLRDGRIPVRVTHNDTKFNNILFDGKMNAVCIVDLDTVMPGTVLYDFGDAIRTGTSRAAEDEKELSKVKIDLELFRAYTTGYLETAGRFLNKAEIEHLAFSARFMTFIIGLRFLTDHINGDHYFRIAFPGHNLQRARAQFRLLETMEKQSEKMEEIVYKALGNSQ